VDYFSNLRRIHDSEALYCLEKEKKEKPKGRKEKEPTRKTNKIFI
jgi:hypothetical protein